MNKNLKKVISTVAALAISASSFVALAATSFPDVEETAAYSKAVKELVGLGIVNGYEDGTFGPDKLVTRAEITKMIVAAIGMTSGAEASASSNTQFSDVTSSHWAAGYVTVGTNQGFINGMGDGTFAPDANVQFLQAEKMLIGACGYTQWAENAGGWPSGYNSYANNLGLAKNVQGNPTNTTELNRGQVAQLISNAIDTPVCVQDGYTTNWTGQVPNLIQKNGQGIDYQTLLTKKHNAYKVYGRVTATHRTGGVDADEVRFDVEKADNFDDEYYKTGDEPETITALIGDSGADNYLLEYSEAIVQENDNDEWVIISITSTSKNDIVTYNADMFDADNSSYTDGAYVDNIMYFFTDDAKKKTTSYKLNQYNGGDQDAVVYYVNGVEDAIADADDFEKYVENNDSGTITLIDAPASGATSTDGRYDYVMVTYYADGIVDSVTETANPKIAFDTCDKDIKTTWTIDLDDDDTDYSFTLNDEEIAVTDIAENDVLSIAYDVTTEFDNSDFYEVVVSRDVVTGKVTAVDGEDGYQIGGVYYEPNKRLLEDDLVDDNGDYVANDNTIKSGTEYTLYLNAFGKFVSYEEGEGSVKNFAVLESVYKQYGSDWYVSYWDQTGKKQSKKIRNSGSNINEVALAIYDYPVAENADIKALDTEDIADADQKPYSERVAEISVNSSDEVTLKSVEEATQDSGEYKLRTNKVNSIKISESSVILDFSDYEDKDEVSPMSLSSFVDESDYSVYAYSKQNSTSSYRFILVDEGGSDISGNSTLAVYSSQGSTTNNNDDNTIQIKAYANGELTYLVLSTDLSENDIEELSEGTPFFYTTDASGYVDAVYPILNTDAANALYSESAFKKTVFDAAEADARGSFDANLTSDFYSTEETKDNDNGAVNFGTSSSKAYIHFGPVVDKTSSNVTIAAINAEYNGTKTTNVDKCDDYTYDSSVNAYVYDYDLRESKRLEVGSKGSVVKTSLTKENYFDGSSKTYIDWASADPDYVLVKEYDDSVTELLVITNSDR